jgi:transcriptional regulator with XRE-family HTH domain
MQNLTNKLRTLREVHGYKQEFVGNHLGLSQTGYSKIEVGEVDLSVKHLQKLAELHQISPEQLLGWDGKVSINTIQNNENVVVTNHGTYNANPVEDRLKNMEKKLETVLGLLGKSA